MYIELDKAIGAVRGAFEFEVESPANYMEIAIETLKLLPPADVVKRVYRGRRPSDDMVKVVRCKDCKHREYDDFMKELVCDLDAVDPYERSRCAEDDEWFCKDGERKDE